MAKLHLPFGDDVMFAGPANSANVLEEVGEGYAGYRQGYRKAYGPRWAGRGAGR